jgi:hypothetical protein
MHGKYPKIGGFGGFWGWKLKPVSFWTPKGTSLCQHTHFDVLLTEIGPQLWPQDCFNEQTGYSSWTRFKMTVGVYPVFVNYKFLAWNLIGPSFLNKICYPMCQSDEPFRSYSIFLNFCLVPAAILDFKKCTILPTRCFDTHKGKLGLKFGENRLNGSKDI